MVQRITVLLLRCMAAATRLTATVHAPLTLGMFPFRGLTPPATNMQPLRGWVLGEKSFAQHRVEFIYRHNGDANPCVSTFGCIL